jgi:hypothetical protein
MVQLCIAGGLLVADALVSSLVFGYDTPTQMAGSIGLGVLGSFPAAHRVAGLFFSGGG